jgi:putative nucleotidyltransferase with HDIG domain
MTDKTEILNRLFDNGGRLPGPPLLFARLNKMLDNPFTSNQKISRSIMEDPAMGARILKITNSALYSRRREVTSLTDAITFLGAEIIRNLVLQVCLVRIFQPGQDSPAFGRAAFWEHSLGASCFTAAVVKALHAPQSDCYYIGGLLHDIGKLIIYIYYPAKFAEIADARSRGGAEDYRVEERVLGVNHADIGAFLAEKWNFHTKIIQCIRDHHNEAPRLSPHAAVIRISSLFARAAGLCFDYDKKVFDITADPAWAVLTAGRRETVDVERLTFEICDGCDAIKNSVKELLSNKV